MLEPEAPKNQGRRKLWIWIGLGAAGFLSFAWSPDGARLAAGTGLDTVRIWDVQSQEVLFTLPSACKKAENPK